MAKKNVKKIYKENPEERKERVRNEGAAFRIRIIPDKTKYNRKRVKEEMRKTDGKT